MTDIKWLIESELLLFAASLQLVVPLYYIDIIELKLTRL